MQQELCATITNGLMAGAPLVLAGIITQSGSAPRTAGARMLVYPDGHIWGTVGGGRYEAEAIRAAWEMMQSPPAAEDAEHPARIMYFALNSASDMDMICGGNVLIMLELIMPSPENIEFFTAAAKAEQRSEPFVLASRLNFAAENIFSPRADVGFAEGSTRRGIYLPDTPEKSSAGLIPQAELIEALSAPAPFIKKIGPDLWMLEPFEALERIHILGGGHVSRAVADMAHLVSFRTVVLDDRPEFANAERFPRSQIFVPGDLGEQSMDAYFASTHVGSRDAVVIVTRGHAYDRDCLASALRTSAGYIGMIGSTPKRKAVYAALLESGFSQKDLDRTFSPIGLSIGAETPEEIAVSIVGQLIQWRHGKL